METLAHGLQRSRHVDLDDRGGEPWARRIVIGALAVLVVAALAGAIGQQHETLRADTAAASVTVRAPARVRGGLFFEGRLDIVAHQRIRRPRLVLGEGWAEQLQIDTIEPSPASETSSDGRLELDYDAMKPGDHLTIWMQFEANPTGAGRRDRAVTLLDGDRLAAHVPGTITALP